MLELLREYKKKVKSNWLFPTTYGNDDERPKNPNEFTLKFKVIIREMGLAESLRVKIYAHLQYEYNKSLANTNLNSI